MRWLLMAVLAGSLAAASSAADGPRGRIAYARQEGKTFRLHVMNADGTGDYELPGQTEEVNYCAVWSPDGKRLAFTSQDWEGTREHVTVAAADGSGPSALRGPSGRGHFSAWSPDGKQIAFVGQEGMRFDTFVSGLDGAGMHVLNAGRVSGHSPFWLPDGKTIGFTRYEDNKSRLTLRNLDSGEEQELVTLTPPEGPLLAGGNAVSPDGKRIAFVEMDLAKKRASLHTWDVVTKADNLVIEFAYENDLFAALPAPGWSPDGHGLLIPMYEGKHTSLFRVSDDGEKRTRLTPENAECLAGSWTASP